MWQGKTLREVWSEFGSAVEAKYASTRPGSRPALWWLLSSPEPRKRLGGRAKCAEDDEPTLEYGAPKFWVGEDDSVFWLRPHETGDGPPVIHSDGFLPVFESQAQFLRRHGLLFPGELRRIPRTAFEPVPLGGVAER